jgi:hypothetical protein
MPDVVVCVASFVRVSADWNHQLLDRRPLMGRSVRWRTAVGLHDEDCGGEIVIVDLTIFDRRFVGDYRLSIADSGWSRIPPNHQSTISNRQRISNQ